MPDIIITPSSGIIDFFPVSTRVGRIEGSGNTINVLNPSGYVAVSGSGMSINTSAPNALLHAYSSISGATILNLEGTNGSLFSVVDSLSGSLMSVNNNAGLPVFEVFSDDRIIGGRFGQNDFVMTSGGNLGIGTGVPSSKFHVVGTSTFNGDVSSTGSIIAGSGSAANPSFEFVGDVDTGMFAPAANTIALSTSGVERVRISNVGNVGINTTSPTAQLHVVGSGLFASGVNIDNQTASTIASFDSNKNISSLSTSTYPSLTELSYIKNVTSAIQTQLNSKQSTLTNPVTGTGTVGSMPKWGSTSNLVDSIITENSSVLWIAGSLRGTTDNTYLSFDSSSDRVGITKKVGFLSKFTYASGQSLAIAQSNISTISPTATFTDVFVLDSNRNVGIGTASPGARLEILATGTTNVDIAHFSNSNGIEKAIFSLSSAGDGVLSLRDAANATGIRFTTNSSTASYINAGNVGIGTTSPSSTLHVSGLITTNSGNFTASLSSAGNNKFYYNGDNVNNEFAIYSSTIANVLLANKFKIIPSGTNYGSSVTLISNPSSTNQIIYLPTYNDGTLAYTSDINTTQITGILSVSKGGTNTSTYSNGQLLIGSGTSLVANTLSAGTGIAITNGSGTITIATTGLANYDVSILSLGTISGSNAINCGQDRQIQNLTLNGVATTFTKGNGWPSSDSVAREITLNIFASGNTSVTWTIVNDWYRQPDSPLPSGRHIVLLRSIGSGTMQGHYIGNKTN